MDEGEKHKSHPRVCEWNQKLNLKIWLSIFAGASVELQRIYRVHIFASNIV